MEKAINFKIDSELYKKIKIKTVMEDITIKQYILGLIEKDIECKFVNEIQKIRGSW